MPALEMSGTVLSAPEHPHAKVQSPTAQTGRTIRPGFEGCFCWCAPRAVRCFRQALQGIAVHIILWFSCAFLHECEQKREEMVSGFIWMPAKDPSDTTQQALWRQIFPG